MQANYRQIEDMLKSLTPFKGNSMRAVIENGNEYRVISYNTTIAMATLDGVVHYYNPTKYSSTTSRQQGIIRRAWGLSGEEVSR